MVSQIIEVVADKIKYQVIPGDHAPFWAEVSSGHWETATLNLIQDFCRPGTLFIDCGGWIGPTTLAAASMGAEVVVYEPNPVAAEIMRNNISVNPGFEERVTLHEVALGEASGVTRLYNDQPAGFKNSRSTTSICTGDFLEVEVRDVRQAVEDDEWQRASLIKIDVEATEYGLIPSICERLASNTPPLLIEFHPTFLNHDNAFRQKVSACAQGLEHWRHRQWAECGRLMTVNRRPSISAAISAPFRLPKLQAPIMNPKILFT